MKQLERGTFPFRTVSEQFHLIEDHTQTVYIPVGTGAELLERRKSGEISKSLLRQLGQYSVNIYAGHFQALAASGDILPLCDGSYYLENLDLYDSNTGLSLEADSGRAEFV